MDDEKIYVSKGEVVLALLEKGQHSKRYKLDEIWELNLFEIQEAIDNMPTADVQPVEHGCWIEHEIRGSLSQYCSICGSDCGVLYPYHYCPNCGAKMDRNI